MKFDQHDLEELKQIYLKHFSTQLSDKAALELANKLVGLFKVIGRQHIDTLLETEKN